MVCAMVSLRKDTAFAVGEVRLVGALKFGVMIGVPRMVTGRLNVACIPEAAKLVARPVESHAGIEPLAPGEFC